MSTVRDRPVSPSIRRENVREKKKAVHKVTPDVILFDLKEIRQHFDESLSDIKKQFAVAEQLQKDGKPEEAQDIWRSQIVFLESIFDFYIHELSKSAFVKMFGGEWSKSDAYKNFKIPMDAVEEGLENPESFAWLLESLNSVFGSETYLNSSRLQRQLNLLGMNTKEFYKPDTQKRLQNLSDRRNQIAHQGDRKHTNAEKEPIDRKFVENQIEFVAKLVDDIHSEAVRKTNSE